MPIFLTDENFNGGILRGLQLRRPGLDAVRVQDIGLAGADDPTVLDYAARTNRVLLTHDAATIPDFAHGRVSSGLHMPGVLVVRRNLAAGRAIVDNLLVLDPSLEGEWERQVRYLPL